MAFDIESAKKSGYTDAEIASHLAQRWNFDIGKAKSSGYSDGEVIAHLMQKTAPLTSAPIPGQGPQPTPQAGPSIVDRAVGTGEAALTMATGAVGSPLGMIGAGLGAMAAAILDGSFGTPEAAKLIEEAAAKGAGKLTYQPRTEQGQEQVAAIGEVAQNLVPVAGLTGQVQQLSQGARPVAAAATDAARAVPPAAAQAAALTKQVAQAAVQKVRGTPEPAMSMGRGSVGSAGAEIVAQRRTTAEQLGFVGDKALTKGQADRGNFAQVQFENETIAKSPELGAPIRERHANQNDFLRAKIEQLIDDSGAVAVDELGVGRTVDSALVQAAARKKAEYRTKYQAADKAGEMDAPVTTSTLVDYINSNESLNQGNLAGGSIGLLQRELVRLGGADVVDGQLVPRELSLKNMELLRRQMNNAIDSAPDNATNVRAGAQIKGLIDEATEGLGGDLYKEARASRRRYAQLFEDNAIVRDLLRTRRGTADRQVALEDVFRRSVLNGDRESMSMLRRTLDIGDQEAGVRPGTSGPGAQAWKEIRAQTYRHLMDKALSGAATDGAGNRIFSAAQFDRAISSLDKNGRLEFILTKKGAQTIRDLNEIAKVVRTLPPNVVNTSNNRALFAALAEAGVTGSMTGLPLPVLTGLRQLSVFVKDRAIRQRVQEALRTAEKPGPIQVPENRTLQ